MTLDEAIEHAKEVARTCDDDQCAADHMQLAEWLRQARGADKGGRWMWSKVRELKAENEKLRELVRDMWHDGMCECDERGACAQCEYHFPDRMRELGIEC